MSSFRAPLGIKRRSTTAMRSGGRAARWPWSKHLHLSLHHLSRSMQHHWSPLSIPSGIWADYLSRVPNTSRTVRVTVRNDIRDCNSTATQLRLNCDQRSVLESLEAPDSLCPPKRSDDCRESNPKDRFLIPPWSSAHINKISSINLITKSHSFLH